MLRVPCVFVSHSVPLFTTVTAARTFHSTPVTSSDAPKKNPFSDVSADPSKLIALTNEMVIKLQSQFMRDGDERAIGCDASD